MAVSAPPKKAASVTLPAAKKHEKKIEEIINRGSSSIKQPQEVQADVIKNFNVKVLETQLRTIDQLRAKRPRKPTSPKLGISLQDWMQEAIEEKIQRERKKYKID